MTAAETAAEPIVEPADVRRVASVSGLLTPFNEATVLVAADVHVARTLARIGGEGDEAVILAAALAVRAPRLGHVYVDLETIRDTATVDSEDPVDLSALPWPELTTWLARLANSPLVALGEPPPPATATPPAAPDTSGTAAAPAQSAPGSAAPGEEHTRPLRLVGSALYLDRYWREERAVAAALAGFAAEAATGIDDAALSNGVARLFAGQTSSRQAQAAATAVLRRLGVVAGGPGTGKTTTVARIVALLVEQALAAGRPAPLVSLAAPTGKAAARLAEAVHDEALTLTVDEAIRADLLALEAQTIHRLLGWKPGSHSRFRHNASNRLPHDVVIVDETSMVSLTLMARLVEAVRPDARLILVGDPGQLTSIEAGAVLGDIVGPAADAPQQSPAAVARLASILGSDLATTQPAPRPSAIGDGIVVLDRVHRYGGAIAELATAVRRGDADAVLGALTAGAKEVRWIDADPGDPAAARKLRPIHEGAVQAAGAVIDAARAGRAQEAIDALGAYRILCAHRRGTHGVSVWMNRIEGWLAAAVDGFAAEGGWYVGRPLLVTENDYGLRLYNGDTGVVVASRPGRVSAAFERRGQVLEFSPTRLAAVDTVYAMTIHKSQGSQFNTAAVLLPPPASRILTRELLYTAVTRARDQLILAGTEEAIRAALDRPVARASGLRRRLWGDG